MFFFSAAFTRVCSIGEAGSEAMKKDSVSVFYTSGQIGLSCATKLPLAEVHCGKGLNALDYLGFLA